MAQPHSWPLQQCLPLAVLKHVKTKPVNSGLTIVATVLTACGIETLTLFDVVLIVIRVATVLTACGIETKKDTLVKVRSLNGCNSAYRLRY